ncbi:hypothetical protein COCON_G00108800 [Conger conger]|uniref:Uncharacterized protein n=1 Tax=Conger conger TaxID=82655 RepID=A0A9Q1HY58_CONCO|nr:hypothetical protein COCON_G00108800 [Conger conger]
MQSDPEQRRSCTTPADEGLSHQSLGKYKQTSDCRIISGLAIYLFSRTEDASDGRTPCDSQTSYSAGGCSSPHKHSYKSPGQICPPKDCSTCPI